MKLFVPAFVSAFIAANVQGRELQVRLDLKPGEPRNGAFCTDDEKHLLLNSVSETLSKQRNIDPETFLPDQAEWCRSLCMPYRITFCKILQEQCTTGIERRRLSGQEDFSDEAIDVNDAFLLEDLLEEEDQPSHGHVRRLFDEELTTVEAKACKAEKKILMKKFSKSLQGAVQKSCMKLLRQKLRLTCVMF